jgi:hypothetical protein
MLSSGICRYLENTRMPRPKGKRLGEEEENLGGAQGGIDVQYNPGIIQGLLEELAANVDHKCQQIQADTDFMATSLRQAFHLELIKLPTSVKQMSISRFREEFGDSIEAVTRGAMSGLSKKPQTVQGTAVKSRNNVVPSSRSQIVQQTPVSSKYASNNTGIMDTASKSRRAPREGEAIVSANGSPLGEFVTAVKAARPITTDNHVPQTPGVFVPLQNGDLLDLGNVDVEKLPATIKEDALEKMHIMMKNMQSLMSKLEKTK